MNPKLINIVDPCYSKNNLGRSVSVFNSCRLKEAIKMQDEGFKKILLRAQSKHTSGKDSRTYLIKEYCKIFKYTLECTGKMPPVNLKLPQMSLKSAQKSASIDGSETIMKEKSLKTKLFDEKTDMFDFGDDIGNKEYSDIDDFDSSEVHQLINNFTGCSKLQSHSKLQHEEAKLNPETDAVREYLVKCLLKLARYDKQTVLQLVSHDLHDDDQRIEVPKEMETFREYGFSDIELGQLSNLVDRACQSRKGESQPSFIEILDMPDSSTMPIDSILAMINGFSTTLKFLDSETQSLKQDGKTRDLLFRAM